MEIRLTQTVRMALETLLDLQRGTLRVYREGVELSAERDTRSLLERPQWTNFVLPSRIVCTPIRRVARKDPTPVRIGWWEVERDVSFYLRGQRIAVIGLYGQKPDGTDNSDDQSYWGLSRIEYAAKFDRLPEDWRVEVLERSGTSLQPA